MVGYFMDIFYSYDASFISPCFNYNIILHSRSLDYLVGTEVSSTCVFYPIYRETSRSFTKI